MKKSLTFLAIVVLLTISTPVEGACVINGQYYSDTDQPCIDWRDGKVAGSNTNVSSASRSEIAELRRQVVQLTEILQQLLILHGARGGSVTYTPSTPSSGLSAVSVSTQSVTRIDDDRATLRGRLDIKREDEATVYFEYGRSRTTLNSKTARIVLDDRDDEDFTQQVRNLRSNTDYYYRAVAEDERGRKAVGSIVSFDTGDRNSNNDDEEPDVTTDGADDIEETTATLRGEVDMNDFRNGKVFVAYGQDEDLVADIADEYDAYDDIDEEGEDLQITLIDSDLDETGDYEVRLRGLDSDTDYYFAFCVEYEDEDDDETIVCGNVEEFTTDD